MDECFLGGIISKILDRIVKTFNGSDCDIWFKIMDGDLQGFEMYMII